TDRSIFRSTLRTRSGPSWLRAGKPQPISNAIDHLITQGGRADVNCRSEGTTDPRSEDDENLEGTYLIRMFADDHGISKAGLSLSGTGQPVRPWLCRFRDSCSAPGAAGSASGYCPAWPADPDHRRGSRLAAGRRPPAVRPGHQEHWRFPAV